MVRSSYDIPSSPQDLPGLTVARASTISRWVIWSQCERGPILLRNSDTAKSGNGGVSRRIFDFIKLSEVLGGFYDSACSSDVVVMNGKNVLSLLEISNGSKVSLRTLIQKICEPCSLRRSPKSKYVFAKIPSLPSYKLSSLFNKIKNVFRITITIAFWAKRRFFGRGLQGQMA